MSEAVRSALATIVEGGTLTLDDARLAMGAVMDGEATPAQLAALLMGLRMRGETVDELAGFASAMRERVVAVEAPDGTIDVVGTGGDGSGTFNISTAAALVVAAGGIPVAKHGNRAITSKAGSADVLDALGVRIDHDAASAGEALQTNGFAFLFAPNFHPAMKHAGPTRREIGVRTAFNLLGPLTNPAGTSRQLLGIGDATAAPRIAEVAQRLGTERTFVIHGAGIDELPLDDSGVLYHVAPDGDRAPRHPGVQARAARDADHEAGRRHTRRERAHDRGHLPRRVGRQARCRATQRRRGVPRRRRGREPRRWHRAGSADDRRRDGHRSARATPRRARRARPRGSRDMTAVAAGTNVVEQIAERRRADLAEELDRSATTEYGRRPGGPTDRRPAGRPGSARHRRAQAVVAVGRSDRRRAR